MPTYGLTLFVEAEDDVTALQLAKAIRSKIPEASAFPVGVANHRDATPECIARGALTVGEMPWSYVGGVAVDD